MKEIARFTPLMMIALLSVTVLSAQGLRERDSVPLKNWDAPMYWQPSAVESKDAAAKQLLAGNSSVDRESSITAQAQTPANSLVFVGMTPCRVVDTRGGIGPFGGPSLIGGTSRTFPIQSSATCSIPSIAQAYSFNITVVPPGFLDFITVWPTGQARPLASTLNGYVNTVIANAAIAPAGTNGSVDVFASQNTHLIIDINGYYAAQTGITLAQGTAAAPSLSFAGDAGTGIFSSGAGNLNVAAGGASAMTVTNGGKVGIGTATPDHTLSISGGPHWTSSLWAGALSLSHASAIGWQSNSSGQRAGIGHSDGGLWFFRTASDPGTVGSVANYDMVINDTGRVGIGTNAPGLAKLQVEAVGFDTGVFGVSSGGTGVYGSSGGTGVFGVSSGGGYGVSGSGVYGVVGTGSTIGVYGSGSGYGVYGLSSSGGYAGYFDGLVYVGGYLDINLYASGGTATVCRNGTRLAVCSSSLRYKTAVEPFLGGLELLNRLRPISFTWKSDGAPDLGLAAEDVAAIEPRLVTRNESGEVEGVKYDHLNVVLINAVKEQQAQIEDQQKRNAEQQEQLEQQQRQIDSLKLLVCLDHPDSVVCN